ncbi:phage tail tape measure protein [Breoghania sp. L-A4]|uniref:phage tail tape measure protein n=1 Tax=Breoghania sp. L-A4 TaxID=2304600 RepID=UPI000E359C0B|nr:phage tail tape measure protein [Breoghania sp. L-A4]AXS39278.1 phage tail tape measure protein [Breoghania sp. L-A4]
MSTSLSGISAGGLAEIMAEAGQAGIAMERLGRFTNYTAKASVAFDMAAGETGSTFAKLGNVYQLNQQRLEHLADATNLLSNNMAAKASEILNFTNRAAGAADVLNLLPEQMAAVGAAMTAAGVVPETAARGLNAFSNKMVKGGPKIERAFKSIGLSFKQWSKLKKENGPQAMRQLFESLNKDSDGARAMQDLFGQDFSDDFGKLMKNPKLLAQAFQLAGEEARIAGSVQAEYSNKVATDIGRIRRLGNHLKAIGIRLGNMAAGPLGAAAERISGIFDTLDQRVTVFDKIKAGLDGLAAGLGFTDAGGAASSFADWLETSIFGQLESFEQDTDRLGRISNRFMEIGRNFRSAFDAFTGGQGAGVAMASAGAGLSKLGGAMTLGGAVVLGLTAAKLLRFSGALAALGLGSRLVRFGVIAAGLSQLASSGGEMSAVDWAVSAAGVGMLGAELFKLGRGATAAYRGLKTVLTGAKALGAGAATGAAAKTGLLSGLLANPLGAGAAALTGATAFGMWAAAKSDPNAKNKDLIADAQRRNRTGSGVPVIPRGDYTLGGFGGFRGRTKARKPVTASSTRRSPSAAARPMSPRCRHRVVVRFLVGAWARPTSS